MNNLSAKKILEKEYISMKELGFLLNIHRQTIFNWMKVGRLPYMKNGRVVRFRVSELKELGIL